MTKECRHSASNYTVDPNTGDVWCFVCNPPKCMTAENTLDIGFEILGEYPDFIMSTLIPQPE